MCWLWYAPQKRQNRSPRPIRNPQKRLPRRRSLPRQMTFTDSAERQAHHARKTLHSSPDPPHAPPRIPPLPERRRSRYILRPPRHGSPRRRRRQHREHLRPKTTRW